MGRGELGECGIIGPAVDIERPRGSGPAGGAARSGDPMFEANGSRGRKEAPSSASFRASGLDLGWYDGLELPVLIRGLSWDGEPYRCGGCCCFEFPGDLGGVDADRGMTTTGTFAGGPGVPTRPCSLWGRSEVAALGDTAGLGKAGTGGCFAQVCSPKASRGTGWLQLEHFTVGKS